MCPDCARERAAREEAERERDEAREEIARHPRRCTADNKCEPCRSEERAWAETDAAESALASQRAARERAEREYEETILKLEAQMSGMEDAYRDSERARREAEDEIDRMRVAAAENFDESVAAQEIALAASSRLAAAEECLREIAGLESVSCDLGNEFCGQEGCACCIARAFLAGGKTK